MSAVINPYKIGSEKKFIIKEYTEFGSAAIHQVKEKVLLLTNIVVIYKSTVFNLLRNK